MICAGLALRLICVHVASVRRSKSRGFRPRIRSRTAPPTTSKRLPSEAASFARRAWTNGGMSSGEMPCSSGPRTRSGGRERRRGGAPPGRRNPGGDREAPRLRPRREESAGGRGREGVRRAEARAAVLGVVAVEREEEPGHEVDLAPGDVEPARGGELAEIFDAEPAEARRRHPRRGRVEGGRRGRTRGGGRGGDGGCGGGSGGSAADRPAKRPSRARDDGSVDIERRSPGRRSRRGGRDAPARRARDGIGRVRVEKERQARSEPPHGRAGVSRAARDDWGGETGGGVLDDGWSFLTATANGASARELTFAWPGKNLVPLRSSSSACPTRALHSRAAGARRATPARARGDASHARTRGR